MSRTLMPGVCMRAELLPPEATLPHGCRQRTQAYSQRVKMCVHGQGLRKLYVHQPRAQSTSHLQVGLGWIFLMQVISLTNNIL